MRFDGAGAPRSTYKSPSLSPAFGKVGTHLGVLVQGTMSTLLNMGKRRLPAWFLVISAGLLSMLATAAVLAQEPAPQAAPPAASGGQLVLASGPGADVFQRACVLCHPPDRIVSVRKTKSEWEEVIDKMITKGAQVNDDNYAAIEGFLLRNYGKVNVNKAPKDDLVMVAGVTPAEADAILKFRTENGPFADFDALTKVPGLDAKKLEEKRDAFMF
jgi:competence protein ComEA